MLKNDNLQVPFTQGDMSWVQVQESGSPKKLGALCTGYNLFRSGYFCSLRLESNFSAGGEDLTLTTKISNKSFILMDLKNTWNYSSTFNQINK